jgi:hypothetical protein
MAAMLQEKEGVKFETVVRLTKLHELNVRVHSVVSTSNAYGSHTHDHSTENPRVFQGNIRRADRDPCRRRTDRAEDCAQCVSSWSKSNLLFALSLFCSYRFATGM